MTEESLATLDTWQPGDRPVKFDWFPCYAIALSGDDDWRRMQINKRGAYWSLLLHQWIEGPLPPTTSRMAGIVGCSAGEMNRLWSEPDYADDDLDAPPRLEHKFANVARDDAKNGWLINERLEDVYYEQLQKHLRRVNAGREGGRVSKAKAKPKQSTPSKPKADTNFDAFWAKYPKKKSRGDALKAWDQVKADRPDTPTILAKLDALMRSAQWTKDGGQFIPHPASWLRAHGWHDDPTDGMAKAKAAQTDAQAKRRASELEAEGLAIIPRLSPREGETVPEGWKRRAQDWLKHTVGVDDNAVREIRGRMEVLV